MNGPLTDEALATLADMVIRWSVDPEQPAAIREWLTKILSNLDPDTVRRVPEFLAQGGGRSQEAHSVLMGLILSNESSDIALRGYLNHFDVLSAEPATNPSTVLSWIEYHYVVKYTLLHTLGMPLEQEREIVRAIREIQRNGMRPYRWIVTVLAEYPEKTDQIIELVWKRKITDQVELEHLISEDIHPPLIDGAL